MAIPGLSAAINMKRDSSSVDAEAKWFHVIVTTYGAWLPGDPRGFRTRHHREDVQGDYKNPPPADRYRAKAAWSRFLMKQPPVVVPENLREVIGELMLARLQRCGALVVCIAVAGQHVHFLTKMPKPRVRHWTGLAKKHVTFELRHHGWQGKLWGVRCKVVPILDRRHQINVFNYILRHREEGAWVWRWQAKNA
jgi:hypothetical protein